MKPQFIHEFLLAHADGRGLQTAIISADGVVTHRELAEAAVMMANDLRALGLQPGQAVVVLADPSIEAVALVCACSIVGAVYVPVDADAPRDRQSGIICDVDAALVVSGANRPIADWTERCCAVLGPGFVLTEASEAKVVPAPADLRPEVRGPNDACYMLFTSGTTGKPKGIVMSHRAVLVFWESLIRHVNPTRDPGLRVGSFSSLHFDFSLLDWGLGLGSGGSVALIDRVLFHQPRAFLTALHDLRVILMSGVPSLWANVLKFEPGRVASLRGTLRALLFAGEAFPVPWLHSLRDQLPGLRLINCFGHSESIACTFYDLPDPLPVDWTDLPISWRSTSGELFLLNKEGAVGEIAVRSRALFDGYFRDPEATAAALIEDPVNSLAPPVFLSGDLGEVGPDGLLRFRGRRDNQVKVLGNRVELEEIDAHAMSVRGVQAAVAVKSGEEIWLAVEPSPSSEPDLVDSVANHLRLNVPRYMVPSRIHLVVGIHRNVNGKADRRRMLEEMM